MNQATRIMVTTVIAFCLFSGMAMAQVVWDFEDGNDHGFTLWSVNPATPAPDDPETAGDEAITGVGGSNGLPDAGCCWTIGPPNQFEGLFPAIDDGENCHDDTGVLEYTDCNDPFGVFLVDPPSFVNSRGQSSYLNTYNLTMWGDDLHTEMNDQIATSPPVILGDNAELVVWSYGGGSTGATIAPDPDINRETDGYWERSCGIAVLSASDNSFLASVLTQHRQNYDADTLDLSAYAGQTIIVDVVDAFQGGWGWLAVDEIQISNATIEGSAVENTSSSPARFSLAQNFPNPFNPTTEIAFSISETMQINLAVYNIHGESVKTIVNEKLSAGSYKYSFAAQNLPSGVYFYKLQSGDEIQTRKMVLMK